MNLPTTVEPISSFGGGQWGNFSARGDQFVDYKEISENLIFIFNKIT